MNFLSIVGIIRICISFFLRILAFYIGKKFITGNRWAWSKLFVNLSRFFGISNHWRSNSAPVFNKHAPTGASSDTFNEINLSDDHSVILIQYKFLLFSHSRIPSVALNYTVLSSVICHCLSISAHVFNLLKWKLNYA